MASLVSVFAATAGGIAFAQVSAAAVAGIVSFVQRCSFRAALAEQWSPRLVALIGSVSLGGMAALAVETHPASLVLLVAPAVLVQSAYARALDQSQERQRSEALRDAAKEIRDSLDLSTVRAVLVETAQRLLGASTGRLVPKTAARTAGALRAEVDDNWDIEVESRIGGGGWEDYDDLALRSLAAIGHDAIRNAELFGQIQAITHSQGEGVIALDGQGRITFANNAAETHAGAVGSIRRTDRAPSRRGVHLGGGRPAEATTAALTALLAGTVIKEDDAVLRGANARSVPVAYTASPLVTDRDSEASGAVIAIRDITERKAFEEQLTYQAFHDPLTGLPNRRLFLDRLSPRRGPLDEGRRCPRAAARGPRPVQARQRFARACDRRRTAGRGGRPAGGIPAARGHLRPARWRRVHHPGRGPHRRRKPVGAGRPDGRGTRRAVHDQRARAVRVGLDRHRPHRRSRRPGRPDVVRRRRPVSGQGARASTGYAVFSGKPSEEALDRLETRGRACAGRWSATSSSCTTSRSWRRPPGFSRVSRPWSAGTSRRAKRCRPGSFVPLAEETGLILHIGSWVLAKAARQAQAWTVAHPERPPLSVSVNLSARQFAHPGIVGEVAADLGRLGAGSRPTLSGDHRGRAHGGHRRDHRPAAPAQGDSG